MNSFINRDYFFLQFGGSLSIHADGLVEHDGHIGELPDQLNELGITENTIVLYTTDNGAEIALWPDGAMTAGSLLFYILFIV